MSLKHRKFSLLASIAAVAVAGVMIAVSNVESEEAEPDKLPNYQEMVKTMNQGNYKDAYEGFRRRALDPDTDPSTVGKDLQRATQCLQNLNRVDEIDEFREDVIDVHAKNWRLLRDAAQNYMQVPHYGYMIAGEFHRGQHRGGGKVVNAQERDRVRALQLMQQALPLLPKETDRNAVAEFYFALAQTLLNNRGYAEAWRLQYLTDLDELPGYDDGWSYSRQTSGAPVDENGDPVFHHVPDSWEAAQTDGQRWRWALVQATEASPSVLNRVRYERASFLMTQFGVQTMRQYGGFFGRASGDDDESGTYALHTLEESETIARLATGVKRFELPDEFNFIKIFQQIVGDDKTGYGRQSLDQLAGIFENRRQYPKAADYWRQNIAKYGADQYKKQRLDQIVDNWGQFESIMTQPAGQGATVEFRFRNGEQVSLTAHAIKVEKLLNDVKDYLKSNPNQLKWDKLNISNIGYRLVHEKQDQYLGDEVASWDLELKPRPNHFDKRITVATPLQKAGAYLLTAKMKDGNTSNIVIWLSDTSIVKKPLENNAYYYVADAVSGKPIAGAKLDLFGYRQNRVARNKYQVITKQLDETTDKDGQVLQDATNNGNNFQWIATATTKDGRFAYLGFTGVWRNNYYDAEYRATKVFTITDRPVYRPGQPVKFKFWVRHAQYDKEDVSQFANQTFNAEIRDPKGDKVLTKQVTADAYGGLSGEYELPDDATLGVYGLYVVNRGGGNFRVEEYKKPEFEVSVEAPQEPVMLGEKITAKIEAKYYFGSPVTQAKVKYKILRTSKTQTWYPARPWDWLYGDGYWWFAYDYVWYPGWQHWGCWAPTPWWWWQSQPQPELVAEVETSIGADGTVPVEIDTAIAKEIHGDKDHTYEIVAEVTDRSRRTIVGKGNVIVAREPFKVFAWVDRGYYRVGDVITASFRAITPDNQPVEGDGELTLYRITYNEHNEPVEHEVRKWDLSTNEEGYARLQIKASENGQYRLSYKVTDSEDHSIEGGYVFTIIGEGFDGSDFRFNALELVPDKEEYAPGEAVKLQVNTNRVGSTVLLFVRPANGVYLPPRVLRLEGKSTVAEISVSKKDMPNFFVEAVTVSGGKLYNQVKEIVVPPEKRVLDVEIVSSAEAYQPGEKATVKVKLTDSTGEPFEGSTVLTIYDKSLEYISGGSNVPEIKEFFWKWRRHHNTNTETNLQRWFSNLVLPGKQGMGDLGVFGHTVAEELEELADQESAAADPATRGASRLRKANAFGGGGALGGVTMDAAMPVASAAPGAAMQMAQANGQALGNSDKAAYKRSDSGGVPDAGEDLAQPTVRENFADTALWKAALTTGKDGVAEVELDMPENLTTWMIKVWGMGHGTNVGQGEAEVVTRKDLIVRLQAPRFFVQKDHIVLSANVHNYLDAKKEAKVVLELEGGTLAPLDENLEQPSDGVWRLTQNIEIAAGGEERVDWWVRAVEPGEATVRMLALTDEESDAMQMKFPVKVHGMSKMVAYSGAIRPDEQTGQFTINVPEARREGESELIVQYSPTLAGAMVDALPYLVSYPYGCTEQTLNRFLPTVITQNILIEMDLDLQAIQKKQTNLNAQELGDPMERAEGWKRFKHNPVFDKAEVAKMARDGVKALAQMQLSDGGWGWFSGYGEHSYPHTTALVVHGLQLARDNDVAVPGGVIESGIAWLKQYQSRQVTMLENHKEKKKPYKQHADNIDSMVYMVLVDAGATNDAMRDFLYRDRTKLAVYAMAMYGLALEKQNEQEKLDMILRNISQYVVEDDENQTAYLKLSSNWWYWYGSDIEAQAYYVKLLSRTDPQSQLASRLVKYLLNNRKHATYWNSTRDTAICIEALAEYMQASGEDKPDMVVEVWLDGEKKQEVQITPEKLFTFDNRFVLEGDGVTTGEHTIELRKKGDGPLYYNGYVSYFTLEDYITKAGLEIKVERNYYRLEPIDKQIKVAGSRGQAVDQKVEAYDRVPLSNLDTLESGDLVEVELVIESKNDYEYLVFEDFKAAGFEPVEVRSGYNGNDLGAYVEFRDDRVSFFKRALARGKHSVAYRLRAEIPGRFSALPTKASAMYAPELRANSDEIKLKIEDVQIVSE